MLTSSPLHLRDVGITCPRQNLAPVASRMILTGSPDDYACGPDDYACYILRLCLGQGGVY